MPLTYEREPDYHLLPIRHWKDGRPLDISISDCHYPCYTEMTLNALRRSPVCLTGSFRLLDLGCGTGAGVYYLRGQGVEAYGVDIDPNPIMPYDNVRFFNEDARDTHFPDSHFDVIMESWMFEQIALEDRGNTNKDIVLEIRRLLRDGGIFISCPTDHGGLPRELLKEHRFECIEVVSQGCISAYKLKHIGY